MRKSLAAAAALAIAVPTIAVLAGSPAQAADDAQLSVFHGIPGLTVDVYVNGDLTLDNFKPGDLAGPLDLPAGTYTVAITAADAKDDSSPAVGPIDLSLKAGMNYTAVAHLTKGGDSTATLFTNDTSKTAPGEGRLTVRHVAAAPAVDLLAGGSPVKGFTNLSNPDEDVADLPAGTVSDVAVAATGTTKPVIKVGDVTIAEGTNTIAYAYGSLDDDTLAIGVQTIKGLHSAPSGVDAGELGLAAEPTAGVPLLALIAGGLALFGVAFTTRRLVTTKR